MKHSKAYKAAADKRDGSQLHTPEAAVKLVKEMASAKFDETIKGGKIEFRVDRHANLQFIIGKASFTEQQLVENYFAALEEILRLKPAASKGRYVKKVAFSATMSPSVLVDGTVTKPVE